MRRTFFLLLVCTAALGCGGNQPQGAQAAGGAEGGRGAFPAMDVKTITIAPKPIPQTSEFVATIKSLRSTNIQPQVDGFVRQIMVKAGDRVRPGQPLVQIDPEKQQATVSATQSQRASREADLEFARQQLARNQKLFDAGAVSRAELEQAETAVKTAQAQLEAVNSQIRENEVQLQYYRVTAPAEGIVGDIEVRQGDRVTPQTLITTIDAPEGLEAYINVPLERATSLRPGLTVELLDTNGNVITSNPITFIAPRADDATQSILVKATLRTRPPGIRVQQYVRARIVWSNAPAISVPVVAVNRISGQYFVFVAEEGRGGFVAHQKPVTVGDLIGTATLFEAASKKAKRSSCRIFRNCRRGCRSSLKPRTRYRTRLRLIPET